MTSFLQKALYKATALTFEGLAFMFATPEGGEDTDGQTLDTAVTVEFDGCFGGRLILAVSGEVVPHIVSNMLGDDDESIEAPEIDALGELANVICGNVLTGIAGEAETFLLSPPGTISGGDIARSVKKAVETVRVEVTVEGGRAEVQLLLDRKIDSLDAVADMGVRPAREPGGRA
jgi:CheY-specific phosphatase CheX